MLLHHAHFSLLTIIQHNNSDTYLKIYIHTPTHPHILTHSHTHTLTHSHTHTLTHSHTHTLTHSHTHTLIYIQIYYYNSPSTSNKPSFPAAFNAPAQIAAFNTWSNCTFLPRIDEIAGGPDLDTIEKVLDQYSRITRTPSGLHFGVANEIHGLEAMISGLVKWAAETYLSPLPDTSIGPFEVSEARGVETGVVSVECVRKVGEVEKVIATWDFVKKVD